VLDSSGSSELAARLDERVLGVERPEHRDDRLDLFPISDEEELTARRCRLRSLDRFDDLKKSSSSSLVT